jgi:hypothetical protein
MSHPVVVEKYREDQWPSRQERLKAINARVAELKRQYYKVEVVPGEDGVKGEVKYHDLVRAIRFPEATYVRPEDV